LPLSRGAHEVRGFLSFRGGDHDVIGVGQDFVELRRRNDFLGVGGITFSGTRYAPTADVEAAGGAGQFASDRAVSHDQEKLAVQFGKALWLVPQILLSPVGV